MADARNSADEKEFFSRVNLALTDCGRRVLLHLLQRRVGELTPKDHQHQPWSLDEFLNHNMADMLISIGSDRSKKDVLYPFKQDTDLTKWDIPLFVFVLLNVCELDDSDSLHRQLKHDIFNLRNLRNRMLHKGTPTLDEPIYCKYFGRIVGAVQRICDYMQEPNLKECLLKELDKYESLKHVYPNGLISELGCKSVDILNEADAAVENGLQKMQMIIQKRGLSVNIPVLEVMVMFRNYNKEDERSITERLLRTFSEALEHGEDMSADRSSSELGVEVKSLVRKLFDEKKEITMVSRGCLVLSIQCHSMDAVISLVQDSLSGKLGSLFEPLEEVMRTNVDHALFEVCVGITKKSCWALLNEMFCQVSNECGQRSYTVECTGQGGGIVVRIQRFLQSFTEKENLEKSFSSKEKQEIYKTIMEKFTLNLQQPGMEMVVLSPKHSEGTSMFGEKCRRSHNILDGRVKSIVEEHGISTKGTPTEMLAELSDESDSGVGSAPASMFGRIFSELNLDWTTSGIPLVSPVHMGGDLLKHPNTRNAATKICESYNRAGGCRNDEAGKPCPFLHLCKNYITRECMTENCQRSHFIHESTVRNVLEKHDISMGRIPKENLAVFRKIMQANDGNYSGRDGSIPEPMFERNAATEICESYNKNGGCRKDKAGKPCPYLHLCKNYIIRECKRKNCQRSHFIHESMVRNVLEKHDISMGRIPKENLAVFRKIMQANDGNYSGRDGPIPEPMFERGRPPQGKLIRPMSGMTIQDSGVEPTSRRPPLFPAQGGAEAVIPGKRTTRSAYSTTSARTMRSQSPVVPFNSRRASPSPVGRVRQATSDMVSETAAINILNKKICIYHLKGRCAYFKRCFNYHCELLYQWFYRFDDSDNWKTVEPQENMRMELHYSDPANVEYSLFIEDMSVQLKFKTMKAEGGGKHLTFHRLSTETSAILDSHPLATSWQWFWMGGNGDWNKYGDDADGYRSTISSQDLEQAYISNPDGQLKLSTQGHEYILDFAKMVQRNLFYTTEREVSRRPKFVSKDELERRKKQPIIQRPAGAATSGFVPDAPPHWNLRPTDELLNHCKLVPLDKRNPRMNTEYNSIEKMFFETMPNTVAIVSIDRVENGDLWHNYVSKKDKLKKRNKGVDVEERQLFFGTSNDTVEAIYRQGFDFRLNGTASGARYGKGSYFATTAKYSHCYTDRQKETMGMFVSKVLVGDYTKGDKSYIRPPQKDPLDLSSPLYDSCVDSVTDPKIFVIFELGQVYPEYLIKYKSDELLNHCKLVPFEEENATLKKVEEVENIGIMRKRLEAQNKQLTGENSRLEDDNSKMKELHQRQEETIKKLTDENLRTKQLEKYCFLYYWLHSDCHVSLETPARTYISIHPPDTKGFHSHQPNVVQSLDEDIKRLGNPTEIMPLVGLNVNEIDEWYKTIDVHFEQWTDDYRMLETALVKGSDDFKNYLAKHKPSIPNKMCPHYIYSAAWEHTLTNCDNSRWHND
ncbi:uncharacterized protein LOC128202731 isoform X3 [Mya arenaria]|uniref:uncharacterized protein LOC128202731 isoform X3 n=1 Tax=Mya arenaria TaxID=6604 RepID=UPI0022E5D015|nr:uncharacterized protein LOC128202731 isoform X3 [Mya arenaria]